MTDKVIKGNFSPKRNDIVLTCTNCKCQQFYLVMEPLEGDKNGQMVAECASCGSPELLVKAARAEEFD